MKIEELSEDELRNLLRQRLKELANHFKPSISEDELGLFLSVNMNMINDEIACK